MDKNENHPPFYGVNIYKDREKEVIETLLKKYRNETVTEELQKKIWDELQMEKYKGNIKIPFKVVFRRDPLKKYPNYIEIILDTKV